MPEKITRTIPQLETGDRVVFSSGPEYGDRVEILVEDQEGEVKTVIEDHVGIGPNEANAMAGGWEDTLLRGPVSI